MKSHLSVQATLGRLAGRLAVCQILGTILGLAAAYAVNAGYGHSWKIVFGSIWIDLLVMVAVVVLVLGIPLYFLALATLLALTHHVLRWPFAWSVVMPAVLFALALWAFPIAKFEGIFWIALIPLCATLAGLLFYFWLRAAPLISSDTANSSGVWH